MLAEEDLLQLVAQPGAPLDLVTTYDAQAVQETAHVVRYVLEANGFPCKMSYVDGVGNKVTENFDQTHGLSAAFHCKRCKWRLGVGCDATASFLKLHVADDAHNHPPETAEVPQTVWEAFDREGQEQFARGLHLFIKKNATQTTADALIKRAAPCMPQNARDLVRMCVSPPSRRRSKKDDDDDWAPSEKSPPKRQRSPPKRQRSPRTAAVVVEDPPTPADMLAFNCLFITAFGAAADALPKPAAPDPLAAQYQIMLDEARAELIARFASLPPTPEAIFRVQGALQSLS